MAWSHSAVGAVVFAAAVGAIRSRVRRLVAPAPGVLPGPFGSHIEGASVDPNGNLYATHFRNTGDNSSGGNNVGRNVIGRSDGLAWFTGEDVAVYNGMKWDPTGEFVYLADVGQGKVVKLNTQTMTGEDHCSDARMKTQGVPNDLALSKSGLVFLSGQDWGTSTGAVWLCRTNGEAVLLETMGRTNGIALSPDDATLYLTEANGSPVSDNSYLEGQRIWKYDVAADGSISNKVEFFNFATDTAQPEATVDTDGMRTDVEGNLYVTRNGNTKLTIISPDGTHVRDIPLTAMNNPTNLAFGGEQGDRIYVVGRCLGAGWSQGDGCVDVVQALHPGREWAWFQEHKAPSPPTPPAPTPKPPTPTPTPTDPPTPTPPTGGCEHEKDCNVNPWCADSGFEAWCRGQGLVGSCPSPYCKQT